MLLKQLLILVNTNFNIHYKVLAKSFVYQQTLTLKFYINALGIRKKNKQ